MVDNQQCDLKYSSLGINHALTYQLDGRHKSKESLMVCCFLWRHDHMCILRLGERLK